MTNWCSAQSGNVMIEFAIIASFLVILLSVTFDFSLAIQEQSVMADAARMGARAGTKQAPTIDDVREAAGTTALKYLEQSGYLPADYTITTSFQDYLDSDTQLISVNVKRTNGRPLLFVPSTVVHSSQTSVFPVLYNICPSEEESC